ncbi:MAG: o-succinylbenzoate synthase [Prochlorococcus sp.]
MALSMHWKPFGFRLRRPLQTSKTLLEQRQGWLLRLEDPSTGLGWGEVSPLDPEGLPHCLAWLEALGSAPQRADLEQVISQGPAPVGFALGAALAELDGLVGEKSRLGWLPAPASAKLLPAGEPVLDALECALEGALADGFPVSQPLTLKWKVAAAADGLERRLLLRILEMLPETAQLRLDANGGWDRSQAQAWVQLLLNVPALQWLEQPLQNQDLQGLRALSRQLPVALDESLCSTPELRQSWLGWQVRRPLVDGDPRPLLQELTHGAPQRMISTAFETGIGARWIHHLAALQVRGPTPAAPGLAPGWCGDGPLFSSDPAEVWEAA